MGLSFFIRCTLALSLFGPGLALADKKDPNDPLQFDHHVGNFLESPSTTREKAPPKEPGRFNFLKLTGADVTPRDACGLLTMVAAYVQLKDKNSPLCDFTEVTKACEDLKILTKPVVTLTDDEKYKVGSLSAKVMGSVNKCMEKINDWRFADAFKKRELMLQKKKDLVELACKTMGSFATGGKEPSEIAAGREVDYENPCKAMLRGSESRLNDCLKSGGDICKIAMGKVELENLIPPDIYDISVSKNLPIKQDAFIAGSLDGAISVLRDNSAEKLNEMVTKKLVKAGGYPASVAMAAITSAASQIYEAGSTGNNAWAHCLGTDNLGACLYEFFAGGIPKSSPVARPRTVDGKTEIDCCRCTLEMYEDTWNWRGQKPWIGREESITPIESGDFKDSFCAAREGSRIDRALLESRPGVSVYFRAHDCRKVTIEGKRCAFPPPVRPDRNLKILKDEKTGPETLTRPTIPLPPGVPKVISPFGDDEEFSSFYNELPPDVVAPHAPNAPPLDQPTSKAPVKRAATPEPPSVPRPAGSKGPEEEAPPPPPPRPTPPTPPAPSPNPEPEAKAKALDPLPSVPPIDTSARATSTTTAPPPSPSCSCQKEWGQAVRYGNDYWRWEFCAIRQNRILKSSEVVYSNDLSCVAGCERLRRWVPGCADSPPGIPDLSGGAPQAGTQSVVRPSPQSEPSLLTTPATQPALNYCSCRTEWSQFVNGYSWRKCVLRKGSQLIDLGLTYANDLYCSQRCGDFLSRSDVAAACRVP